MVFISIISPAGSDLQLHLFGGGGHVYTNPRVDELVRCLGSATKRELRAGLGRCSHFLTKYLPSKKPQGECVRRKFPVKGTEVRLTVVFSGGSMGLAQISKKGLRLSEACDDRIQTSGRSV